MANGIIQRTVHFRQRGLPGEVGNGVSGIASSFNLSKHGTSTNESTPPSDLYYGTWQTSQPEPTDAYPYSWKREVITYSKSISVTRYYCIGKKGEKGEKGEKGDGGDPGQPGAAGKWYEYAGEWIVGASAVVNTSVLGKYVKYGNNFYMNIHTDGQVNTTTPGTDNTKWSQMNGEREYYMAKAFFGPYAEFGSFIINEDWMICRNGTLRLCKDVPVLKMQSSNRTLIKSFTAKSDGSHTITITSIISGSAIVYYGLYDPDGTQIGTTNLNPGTITATLTAGKTYTVKAYKSANATVKASGTMKTPADYLWFNEADPMALEHTHMPCFAPNYAVDGRTGETYQRKAHIEGEVVANSLNAINSDYETIIIPGMTIWRSIAHPLASIIIGTDSDGMIFKMTDQNGVVIWDISTSGNGKVTGAGGGTYDQLNYKRLSGDTPDKSEFINITQNNTTPYYLYHGQYSMSGNTKTWATVNYISESTVDLCVYTSKRANGTSPSANVTPALTKIPDGCYTPANNGIFMQNQNGDYIVRIYQYADGKLSRTISYPFSK